MDLTKAYGLARQGIYRLGGIEVFTKDGVFAARPMDKSPEAKERAEAYNLIIAEQEKAKLACPMPGDYQWDIQP